MILSGRVQWLLFLNVWTEWLCFRGEEAQTQRRSAGRSYKTSDQQWASSASSNEWRPKRERQPEPNLPDSHLPGTVRRFSTEDQPQQCRLRWPRRATDQRRRQHAITEQVLRGQPERVGRWRPVSGAEHFRVGDPIIWQSPSAQLIRSNNLQVERLCVSSLDTFVVSTVKCCNFFHGHVVITA